jgi:choline dehydrogenase-like flavoprotein
VAQESLGSFDVVIVGAGVIGGLVAYKLAKHGCTVLMLDAGAPLGLGRDGDITRTQLVGHFATEDDRGPGAPYRWLPVHGPESDKCYTHAADSGDRFKSGYVLGAGGTTWHWLGSVPRMLPGDFELRTRYGVGVDWPIGYRDLEPWYGRAEEALGVAGDHAGLDGLHGAHRTAPFPMTEIWPSYSDLVVERALTGRSFEGVNLAVLRTPQARNSRPYDGRPACAGNSICVPICPIGAKYDGTVHVKKALALPQPARLETLATVTRVLTSESGVVSGVELLLNDQKRTAEARAVVLAAHAIETPRLLLASGLANASGQVGRNLMDHTNRFGSIIAREPMFPFRGPPSTSGIDAFRDGAFRRERAAFRLSLGNDGAGRNAPPEGVAMRLVKAGLLGPELLSSIRREIEPLFRVSSSTEVLPSAANGIRLRAGDLKRGLPPFEISFTVDDYTRRGYLYAERVMGAIFEHVGSINAPDFDRDQRNFSGAGHIMGTCRMGNSPSTSVVDASCRAHEHRNLFVAGTSLFPTGGTANPTLTAAALALRLAEHLKGLFDRAGSDGPI